MSGGRVDVEPNFDAPVRVPVAIVGAGACGLVAALRAREAGVECVVLERDAVPSGSTALSSGFVPAGGTRVQRAAGVDDSPARFARDIRDKAKGSAAEHLVVAYADAIAPAIDWLGERHGLAFELLDGFLYPGHRARRMHALPERTGAALAHALEAAARAAGADLLCDARVDALVVDRPVPDPSARVLGVRFARPDGDTQSLACDALVLACNGFAGDPALVARHLPQMRDAVFAGHAGNDGSALRWGERLGAALADLHAYPGHGSWAVPHGVLITWAVMVDGGVQVNARGERFHDETRGYSEAAVDVIAQPGGVAWAVFDAPVLALAQAFPDFLDAQAAGAVRHADDVAALAATIGCDAGRLARTLDEAAASGATGAPDRFGRRFARALAPPYCAIRVTGALLHTQGGLDVDARCRVLARDGTALPNLFAGGGAARGVSGDAVWGYLSGNGLLSAIAGGWIAGAQAARYATTGSVSTP